MFNMTSLMRYFVSAGLSPNPPLESGAGSPPSGRGFLQNNCIYLGLKLEKKEGNYNILNDFSLSLGRGGSRGRGR